MFLEDGTQDDAAESAWRNAVRTTTIPGSAGIVELPGFLGPMAVDDAMFL